MPRKPTTRNRPSREALASGNGSEADRCAECGCKAPGHKLDCVSSNERARKYQAELSAKYLNRGRRKGKRRSAEANGRAGPVIVIAADAIHEIPVSLRHGKGGEMEILVGDWVYVRTYYDYRYTSNASRLWLAREIVKLLTSRADGVDQPDAHSAA